MPAAASLWGPGRRERRFRLGRHPRGLRAPPAVGPGHGRGRQAGRPPGRGSPRCPGPHKRTARRGLLHRDRHAGRTRSRRCSRGRRRRHRQPPGGSGRGGLHHHGGLDRPCGHPQALAYRRHRPAGAHPAGHAAGGRRPPAAPARRPRWRRSQRSSGPSRVVGARAHGVRGDGALGRARRRHRPAVRLLDHDSRCGHLHRRSAGGGGVAGGAGRQGRARRSRGGRRRGNHSQHGRRRRGPAGPDPLVPVVLRILGVGAASGGRHRRHRTAPHHRDARLRCPRRQAGLRHGRGG